MYRIDFHIFELRNGTREPEPAAAFKSGYDAFAWCEDNREKCQIEFSGRVFHFDPADVCSTVNRNRVWQKFVAWIGQR